VLAVPLLVLVLRGVVMPVGLAVGLAVTVLVIVCVELEGLGVAVTVRVGLWTGMVCFDATTRVYFR
jgi:hypothetical protein